MKHLLRSFFFSASFVLFTFLVSGSSLLISSAAKAQGPPPPWSLVTPTPFTSQIHIVKFNDFSVRDASGAPQWGFVSDGPEIWYCTDGGKTVGGAGDWALAPITGINPTPFTSGWVNDISFKDDSFGVAIVQGNSNPTDHGVLLTTNGGQSWTFDDHLGTPDSGNGIYWNPSNNRIFVASLDKGLVVSADNGVTWSVIDTNKYYTGFAFTSGSRGIVATEGSNPSGNLPSNFWKYTTDGGLTWDPSRMFYESWQPVGILSTETFFGATNNYLTINSASILRSDNSGYSFLTVPASPNASDGLNQSMQGDGCSLFAASTDAASGMWYSISDGNAWQPMPPTPPNPPTDTRFYVSPTTVWSFTTKVLEFVARVATPAIHVWPSTLNFTNASCNIETDTVVHIFGCNCSNNPTLTGSSVYQTQTQDQLTVLPGTVPRPLCSSATAPLGNPDAVTVQYKPTSSVEDTGGVVLNFSENGTPFLDTVFVTGNPAVPSLSMTKQRIVLSAPACGAWVDTCITITNTGCIPITIRRTNFTSDNPCILFADTITQATLTPGINPSVQFCFHFRPSLQKGGAIAYLSFTWTTGNGQDSTTKLLEIDALTTTTIQPSFRGFRIGFDRGYPRNCCDIPTDTTIYFLNNTCDTLTLNAPNFFGATNPNEFTLNPSKPPLVFPIKLAPGGFGILPLSIHIDCRQGTDSEKVQFTYTVGTTGGDCSSLLTEMDTAIIAVKSSGPITPASVSPKSLSFFGSCCDSTQVKTFTIITGCKFDTLIGISPPNNGATGRLFLVSPPTVPLPLDTTAGKNRVPIQVGFWPSSAAGNIVLTFSSGLTITVGLTGSCSNEAAASLSTDNIDFGLLACNQSACDSVWIKNASCGAIKINSIQEPAAGSPFTLDTTGIQLQLAQGDSTKVHLCVTPNTTAGASGMVVFIIASLNGSIGIPDTLNFTATFTPPLPADSLTQLAAVTICDTSTLDETFTFFNIGQCYTYKITGFTATDNGNVTVTPVNTSYPVYVGVGAKQIFQVHFDPKNVAKNLTGNITLTDSGGNTITVPYDITVDSCNISGHLVVTMPGNTIVTPNCTQGTLPVTIGAGGGAGTVTSVTVTGSTRFSATNPITGPMPFTDTVIFDPNLTGGNSATLTINYIINGKAGDTTIPLTATVTGTKFSARIGVTTPSDSCISPNDTDLKEFDINLYDSIPDSLGMNRLSFVLHYNGDLLWNPKNLNFGTGWNIVSETQENDGLHVTLSYTGTGTGSSVPGTVLIKIQELGALTKILSDTAHVTDPHFNDSAYEACVLKAFAASGDSNSAPICITTNNSCNNPIILKQLQGNLQAVVTPSSIEVIPNPAHKDGSAATLHFTSNVNAPMTVDVLNVLGNSVAQLANGPVTKGDHALAIPTNDMPEGAYFVRISVNGYTVVRKFLLEKE